MKKRLLLILGIVILAANVAMAQSAVVWDGSLNDTLTSFSGGDGSEGSPYEISSVADLLHLSMTVNSGTTYVDKYFVQTVDLDLGGVYDAATDSWSGPGVLSQNWFPIGSSTQHCFKGTFDGKGYSIHNIYFSDEDILSYGVGLFGYIKNATLKNINMVGGYISSFYAGGIVGLAENSSIIDSCNSSVTLYGTSYRGGICGVLNGSTVSFCTYIGDITYVNENLGYGTIGGICGYSHSGSKILNCVNAGYISIEGTEDYGIGSVGGICGSINGYTEITGCLNVGQVVGTNGSPYIGAIVGEITNKTGVSIKSCLYDKQICLKKAIGDGGAGSMGNDDEANYVKGLLTSELTGTMVPETYAKMVLKAVNDTWIYRENMYPSLIADNTISEVGSSPIFLDQTNNSNFVTIDFPFSTVNDVTWHSSNESIIKADNALGMANVTSTEDIRVKMSAANGDVRKTLRLDVSCTCHKTGTLAVTPKQTDEGKASMILSWGASAEASGYNIYRGGVLFAENVGDNTWTDNDIDFDKEYCYKVTSLCKDPSDPSQYIETEYSNEVCKTLKSCKPVNNFEAEPYDKMVTLKWTLMDPDQDKWIIEYGESGFIPGIGVGTEVPVYKSTTTRISGLIYGKTYDFYIRADCGSVKSTWEYVKNVEIECPDYGITDDIRSFCEPYDLVKSNGEIVHIDDERKIILDTLTTSDGYCDSIVRYDITVSTAIETTDTIVGCPGNLVKRHSWSILINQESPGIFEEKPKVTLASASGCDSIVTYIITVPATKSYTSEYGVCDSFTWNGTTYYESGTYQKSIPSSETWCGCDSTAILRLSLGHSSVKEGIYYATECDSFYWNLSNTWYYESTTEPTSRMENATGCDSIVRLNLTIKKGERKEFSRESCDVYTWETSDGGNGKTYYETGRDSFYKENADGCRDIYVLNLIINKKVINNVEYTACDSYNWNGKEYTESGYYQQTLKTSKGCDSTVYLDLTILKPTTGVDVQEVCDSYTWIDGKTYTQSTNTPTWVLTNSEGCDSIVTLNLTIKEKSTGIDYQTACNTFTWIDGKTYNKSTDTPTWTLTNAAGCDSVVTLNLTVNYTVYNEISVLDCERHDWNGTIYTESGQYTQTFISHKGCDSIVILNLGIGHPQFNSIEDEVCQNEPYQLNGFNITSEETRLPGTFPFQKIEKTAYGCDSTIDLSLKVNLSGEYIKKMWSDVVACDNSGSRDGITFVEYQWFKNGEEITGATEQFYADKEGAVGTYQVRVKTSDGKVHISCPIDFGELKSKSLQLKTYPNPVSESESFEIELLGFDENDLKTTTLYIHNSNGKLVQSLVSPKSITEIELPIAGEYIFTATIENGDSFSCKVLVKRN